ncbi:uncharacterized protein LOC121918151 [Sceloporus undulatus]|uniref:uncharacterized protein LOC121918151 n=1 Tax=Sceloporus undulatus TaxID=8520 RepID=UPI001C4BF4B5|nr:uncharacterized protein LOC121918151 [Sceloporus undulatus]
MGEMSMKTFFDSLNLLETKSLTLTKEVLRERKELETALAGLQAQIKIVCVKVEELRKTQEVLDLHKKDVEANKDFEYEIEVTESVKEPTGLYVTNCRKCNFTCHFPCLTPWNLLLRFCSAISFFSGTCNVCPGRCSVSNHFKAQYRLLHQVVKKTKTFEELKKKYEKSMKSKVTSEKLLEHLKAEEKMEKEILAGLIVRASQSYKRLQEIALKSSHRSSLDYINLLIQEEEREAKPGFKERVLKLKNMKREAELVQRLASTDLMPAKGEHLPEDKEQMKEITDQFLKKL